MEGAGKTFCFVQILEKVEISVLFWFRLFHFSEKERIIVVFKLTFGCASFGLRGTFFFLNFVVL